MPWHSAVVLITKNNSQNSPLHLLPPFLENRPRTRPRKNAEYDDENEDDDEDHDEDFSPIVDGKVFIDRGASEGSLLSRANFRLRGESSSCWWRR